MSGYGSYLSQDAKHAADLKEQQLTEIKRYLGENPEDLQAIAEECAQNPEYTEILLEMHNPPATKLLAIYNAVKSVKKRRQAQQLQDIKEFLKPPHTAGIFDLSTLSGRSPEEIADIVEGKETAEQVVIDVHQAILQMLDAQTELTINRHKKK